MIRRSFATKGQCIRALDEDEPIPASSWDISGKSLDPLPWRYKVELAAPSGNVEPHVVRQSSVAHQRHCRQTVGRALTLRHNDQYGAAGLRRREGVAKRNARTCRRRDSVPIGRKSRLPCQSQNELRNLKGDFIPLESMSTGYGQGPSASVPRLGSGAIQARARRGRYQAARRDNAKSAGGCGCAHRIGDKRRRDSYAGSMAQVPTCHGSAYGLDDCRRASPQAVGRPCNQLRQPHGVRFIGAGASVPVPCRRGHDSGAGSDSSGTPGGRVMFA